MKRMWSVLLIIMMLFATTACGASKPAASEPDASSETVEEKAEDTAAEADTDTEADTRVIVDMLGREVEIPTEINSIICTGSNALRMVTYLQATDLMAGVEETDKGYEVSTKRDYAHAYYETFKDLPVIGKGGGTAYTAYPEEVLKAAPDVILSCYVQEAVEQLQNETGIPVVSIRNASANFIDEDFYAALRLTAELTGTEKRCEELLSYIDECKADLSQRSADIPEEEKPGVYTGAVTFSGAHGFAGTYANFGPFMAINAKNVADETGEKAAFEVDLEKVIVWDPDVIFLDPGNMSLVNEEYASNPDFFHSLTAVQNGEIYTMPSFNNYSTNITYCLMDAYYAGKVLYPERFEDIDMKTKGNEILDQFLGAPYFDEMEADGLYYGKLTLGE
ncbi:MAG: iron ABC transporter substrate-binding protein [Clostridiales bacterium]|nr:iron ABC transporter substrate-binding protein [Clostridiales bacterium]